MSINFWAAPLDMPPAEAGPASPIPRPHQGGGPAVVDNASFPDSAAAGCTCSAIVPHPVLFARHVLGEWSQKRRHAGRKRVGVGLLVLPRLGRCRLLTPRVPEWVQRCRCVRGRRMPLRRWPHGPRLQPLHLPC